MGREIALCTFCVQGNRTSFNWRKLLYGRDPQLPTELVLTPVAVRENVNLDDYKSRMVQSMNEA